IVEGIEGQVGVRSEIRVRFGYGSIIPWAHRVDEDLVFTAGPDALCLRTAVPLRGEDFHTVATFTVSEGERVPFVLTWFPSHEQPPEPVDPEQALRDTETFWRDWADRCSHAADADYHDDIHRSLLVLKALTYAPTGGMVAAPTTSLPGPRGGGEGWSVGLLLLGFLGRARSEPDAGVWEVRGPSRHFTHSKMMAWVAFDRAVKAVEQHGRDGPADRWRAIRDRIHAEVCEK